MYIHDIYLGHEPAFYPLQTFSCISVPAKLLFRHVIYLVYTRSAQLELNAVVRDLREQKRARLGLKRHSQPAIHMWQP
jgi:hypothetical protein